MTARRPYPSDLSDARWALLEPTLSAWRAARMQARARAGITVADPSTSLRDIFDAILYVNRTGIAWKYLPHDFPPRTTVYYYFSAWAREGIFEQLGIELTGLARTREGRNPEPSACVIDSQSVKTSTNVPLDTQGIDAAKKIVGRKRGILTDTLGLLLATTVAAADLSDNAIGQTLLTQASHLPTITKAWVDTGFKNAAIEHGARLGIDVEVVPRRAHQPGFHVVKRRWVVERTLGWLMLHRRLARDYGTRPDHATAMIRLASIDNLTRRITGETTPNWRYA
ncbi:transposase [Nonomuraea thailandensis]|uniref:Transposase n=1 Tax=Nonomuraea thailandensis TaxID=1188745 RepID=A0A9X2GDH9_9ACTN|nr:IS5 family transposase [Nonomuraea thailandensis]MCP2356886.1 transposase [Nonomuraea thailandensis]